MPRAINQAGLELVKEMEGFRADAYVCPAGVWTIGYGHTDGVQRGQHVTREEAEELLRRDLEGAAASVERLITVPLTDNQFAALVSFTFNVGENNLRNSTLRRKLNAGQYDAAPAQLSLWVKATDPATGQKKTLPGLVRRRSAEGQLWLRADEASDAGSSGAMPHRVEAEEGAEERTRSVVIARPHLRLRSGPGLNFDVIGRIDLGTQVYTGREQNGWVEVDLQGDDAVDGWVFAHYLRPVT